MASPVIHGFAGLTAFVSCRTSRVGRGPSRGIDVYDMKGVSRSTFLITQGPCSSLKGHSDLSNEIEQIDVSSPEQANDRMTGRLDDRTEGEMFVHKHLTLLCPEQTWKRYELLSDLRMLKHIVQTVVDLWGSPMADPPQLVFI